SVVADLGLPIVAGHDRAAVAVIGVLAEAHVGPSRDRRDLAREGGQRLRHRPLRIGGSRAVGALAIRDAKKDHGGNAERGQLARLGNNQIGAQLEAARHRGDFATDVLARAYEERRDELVWRKASFAHQPPNRVSAPQAAMTMAGKAHARFSDRRSRAASAVANADADGGAAST